MKYGLSTRTRQELAKVFSRYPEVEEAVLYGSRAKGTYRNGSDIDLTLNGSAELTHTIVSRIANDFYEGPLPYKIDLSIFNKLRNPEMVAEIQRDGVVLYKKGDLGEPVGAVENRAYGDVRKQNPCKN